MIKPLAAYSRRICGKACNIVYAFHSGGFLEVFTLVLYEVSEMQRTVCTTAGGEASQQLEAQEDLTTHLSGTLSSGGAT